MFVPSRFWSQKPHVKESQGRASSPGSREGPPASYLPGAPGARGPVGTPLQSRAPSSHDFSLTALFSYEDTHSCLT